MSSAAYLQTLTALQGKSELAFFTSSSSSPVQHPLKETCVENHLLKPLGLSKQADEAAVGFVPVEPRKINTSVQVIHGTGKIQDVRCKAF